MNAQGCSLREMGSRPKRRMDDPDPTPRNLFDSFILKPQKTIHLRSYLSAIRFRPHFPTRYSSTSMLYT